jgi:beta-N-acetylhexosaminidase
MKKALSLLILVISCLGIHAQTRDSLDIKIGQMIMIGMPKAEVDPIVLEEVRSGKAGAIIYFEKNIPVKNSYMAFKKMSYTYQQAAPIPLFITIDQEGGKVNRMKEKYGFPRSITATAMGKDSKLDSVRFYGVSTGAALSGVGINVNFAPVVDVAIEPLNTVIVKVERSFSKSEDTVAIMAKEFIKTHRKVNVITVLKHFPGHGSSLADTHLGIADVTNTWNERELKPYKALLDSGYVDAIMTSHIVNKKLDPRGYPGTLSNRIMDSLLRKTLGYNGVIFSDDMQMHAITEHYGLEDAIKLAINAGVDIMCFSNNIQGSESRTVDKVHKIIRGYVEKGVISKERIDQSFRRVLQLKGKMNDEGEYYRQQIEMARALAMKNAEMARRNEEVARETLRLAEKQLKSTGEKAAEEGDKKSKKKKKKK